MKFLLGLQKMHSKCIKSDSVKLLSSSQMTTKKIARLTSKYMRVSGALCVKNEQIP